MEKSNFSVTENMQYTVKCINELHRYYETDYIINIDDYATIDDLKNECKVIVNELFHEGYFAFNFKLFLIDMLN